MEWVYLFYNVTVEVFYKVGVFVSISLLLIGLIDYKFNGIIIKLLEKDRRNQVYFSALLGLIPGCGGAIVVVPMYILGKVTFGSLVAAFITTMGDAAFILIVGDITAYFKVLIISGITGVVCGLLIDYFKIGKNVVINKNKQMEKGMEYVNEESGHKHHKHIAHKKGDIVDKVLHRRTDFKYIYLMTHNIWYEVFWFLVIISFPFALEHLLDAHTHENHFIIEYMNISGSIGTILCILYTLLSRKGIQGSNFDKTESKLGSIKETLIHTAEEVAFLVSWVFVAFLGYEILLRYIGGAEGLKLFLENKGFLVVIGAVIIGLIPGCGPQILLAAIYISGGIPFSALVANAICNDGDALFPLLALSKKSALLVTLYNVIPALLIGGFLYLLET